MSSSSPHEGAYLIGLTIQMADQRGLYLFNHPHYLGAYLICLTIQMTNPRGLYLFNHPPYLGACLIGLTTPMTNQRGFFFFLIITPYLGTYLIGLTIPMANQRGFFIFFNHHPLLGCLLDWSYNPNSQSKRFFSFNRHPLLGCLLDWSYNPNGQLNRFFFFLIITPCLGVDLPSPASSPIFIHISGLTFDCQLSKFSFFHLDLPLIASSSNFHFFIIWTYSQLSGKTQLNSSNKFDRLDLLSLGKSCFNSLPK